MTDEQGYNGWKNYETWAMALHIDNDRGTYEESREIVRQAREDAASTYQVEDGTWTLQEAARFTAEDRLKEWTEEQLPELDGFAADLLNAAFGEIDWLEIAENYLEEVETP